MTKRTIKLIREGKYVAEVGVDLIEEDDGWSPYLSVAEALKLDAVRGSAAPPRCFDRGASRAGLRVAAGRWLAPVAKPNRCPATTSVDGGPENGGRRRCASIASLPIYETACNTSTEPGFSSAAGAAFDKYQVVKGEKMSASLVRRNDRNQGARTRSNALVSGLILIAMYGSAFGETSIHHSPGEDLEKIDIHNLQTATRTIDFAAFTLTDPNIIDQLVKARERGLRLRIVLDPSQYRARENLLPLSSVIRFKHRGPYMHLKSYLVDGVQLRSGSANFSRSGLRKQNNDLILIDDEAEIAEFHRSFDVLWNASRVGGATAGAGAASAAGRLADAARGPANVRPRKATHRHARQRFLICNDATTSRSHVRRGACSHHGGIAS